MQFHYFADYDAMSREAAARFEQAIAGQPNPAVCLATGNSTLGMYRESAASGRDYSRVMVVKLDEWLGLPMDHPSTCEQFLRREVIAPWCVQEAGYISFRSQPEIAEEECLRVQSALSGLESLTVCVLGLGRNGHIGLNEPGLNLEAHCHRARLSDSTREHPMLLAGGARVTEGLTLGIADILRADRILLLVAGAGKLAALGELREKRISTRTPASFLWLHPDVDVLVHQ